MEKEILEFASGKTKENEKIISIKEVKKVGKVKKLGAWFWKYKKDIWIILAIIAFSIIIINFFWGLFGSFSPAGGSVGSVMKGGGVYGYSTVIG